MSTSGGGGGTRSDLWDLGIFAGGPEEAKRSALDGALVVKNCALVSYPSGQVIGNYFWWSPSSGGHGGLCDAFGLVCVFFIFLVDCLGLGM